MKILVSVQHYYPSKGGAEISLRTMLKRIAENHAVTVIQAGSKSRLDIVDGIPVETVGFVRDPHCILPVIYQARKWRTIVDKKIRDFAPDLVITQLSFAAPSIDAANAAGIQSLVFVRSYEHFCPDGFENLDRCNHRCLTCMDLTHCTHFLFMGAWRKWNISALQSASVVISNSAYVAGIVRKEAGITSPVIYPAIDVCPSHASSGTGYYLAVSPNKLRGNILFRNIALELPGTQFMAVGGNVPEPPINMVVMKSRFENLDSIYTNARAILAPAVWPEPFGRAPVEAGRYCVPAIVSNRGGLPEAIGHGGIVVYDPGNVRDWLEAIKVLEQSYEDYRLFARQNSTRFEIGKIYPEFIRVCRKFEIVL